MKTNRLLFVIAYNDYQPIEYSVPKNILGQAGYTIITASNKDGKATATDGSHTTVDLPIEQASAYDYDGIFFVGGSGAIKSLDNETSYKLIREAYKLKKVIGAICVATRLLAQAGILAGKSATGWDGDNALSTIYEKHEVLYLKQDVVVDAHIITALGPSTAEEYGQTCLAVLSQVD